MLFTSESVTEGHPDKVADAVSDGVLDSLLAADPNSRVAVETLVNTGTCIVAGEVSTNAYVDIAQIARETILRIGYNCPQAGFDGATCGVLVAIGNQSPDIAQGVNSSWEGRHGAAVDEFDQQGAGDQGLMFGYACDDTESLMPLPIELAHRLSEQLTAVRKNGVLDYLFPDGKTQVTIEYDEQLRPVAVDAIVVSAHHRDGVDLDNTLRPAIISQVISPVLHRYGLKYDLDKVYVNPTGKFVLGGPTADVGVTGRKIIVDTYGGMARHGGGAFSGKDPSKVDRSAAYALRWVAKNVVAAGLARRCEVQVAYAIGKSAPVGFYVDCFGTNQIPQSRIAAAIREVFDLRPAAIIKELGLLAPIYSKVVNYGHFGRDLPELTWERTNRVQQLQQAVRG